MINALHLIWIIPVSVAIGIVLAALFDANNYKGDGTSAVPLFYAE